MPERNIENIKSNQKTRILKSLSDIPRILFVFALLWGGSFVLGRLMLTNLFRSILDEGINQGLRRVVLCGFQIGIFFLWVKLIEKRHIVTLGFSEEKRLQKFLVGIIIGISSITIITIVLYIVGAIQLDISQKNDTDTDTYSYFSMLVILLGWLIQSASEEISIRGWLIPSICRRHSASIAILITSIIFGILHLFVPVASVLSFTNLVLSGMFFALYAIKQKGIWGVWGCHFGWNLSLGNIYGFNVSGFAPKGYLFFKVKVIDYDFLTGGQFGPEGGLLVTILLAIGIVVLLLNNERVGKKSVS